MINSKSWLSHKADKIDTSQIRKLFDMASSLKNPLNLSIGQPDFPVPEPVKEALVKAVRDNRNSYTPTQGIAELRQAISEEWLKNSGFSVSPDNVIVSAGVAPLLYLLYDALFNEGDQILLIDPYFLMYESLAGYHDLTRFYLPENFGQSDADLLMENKDFNPKVIIFASPSNPSGKILSVGQLKVLSGIAEKYNSIIVSDEIYQSFDYEKKHTSMAAINPDRTVTLGGFSKSHAMTGLRVGYMGVGKMISVVGQKVAALQQYSVVCAPQPSQWAAIVALQNPLVDEIQLMKSRRDRVVGRLGNQVTYNYPEGAFYLFINVKEDGLAFVQKALKQELLIVPGHIFSQKKNFIRISYAQKEEVIDQGLEILLSLVQK